MRTGKELIGKSESTGKLEKQKSMKLSECSPCLLGRGTYLHRHKISLQSISSSKEEQETRQAALAPRKKAYGYCNAAKERCVSL